MIHTTMKTWKMVVLIWKNFHDEDLPPKGLNEDLYHYNGPGPNLHCHVLQNFNTVLEACRITGGFMYELINRITANSNGYTTSNLTDGGKFY